MPIIAGRASAAYGAGFSRVVTAAYAGPFGAYDSLATVAVGASAVSSITFYGIPADYKHLQVRLIGRTSRSEYVLEDVNLQMNGDTNSNYSWHRFYTSPTLNATALVANGSSSATYINSVGILGTNATGMANIFGASIIDILDYSSSSKSKVVRSLTGLETNGTSALDTEGFVEIAGGAWHNTSAINSLTFTSTTGTQFVQYTNISLYGVK